jgi:hypothetical protein
MPIYCTPDQIAFIHKNKGKMTQQKIAAAIGKSQYCVNRHINGKVDLKFVRKNIEKKESPPAKIIQMPEKEFFDEMAYARMLRY